MSEFSVQYVIGGKLRLLSMLSGKKILSTKNHQAVEIDGKSYQSETGGSLES